MSTIYRCTYVYVSLYVNFQKPLQLYTYIPIYFTYNTDGMASVTGNVPIPLFICEILSFFQDITIYIYI